MCARSICNHFRLISRRSAREGNPGVSCASPLMQRPSDHFFLKKALVFSFVCSHLTGYERLSRDSTALGLFLKQLWSTCISTGLSAWKFIWLKRAERWDILPFPLASPTGSFQKSSENSVCFGLISLSPVSMSFVLHQIGKHLQSLQILSLLPYSLHSTVLDPPLPHTWPSLKDMDTSAAGVANLSFNGSLIP